MFFFFFDFGSSSNENYDKLSDYQKFVTFYKIVLQKRALLKNDEVLFNVEILDKFKSDITIRGFEKTIHFIFRRDLKEKDIDRFYSLNREISFKDKKEEIFILTPTYLTDKKEDFIWYEFILNREIHQSYVDRNRLEAVLYLDLDLEVNEEELDNQRTLYQKILSSNLKSKSSKVTMVLGAGVSYDYKIKMWDDLLNHYFTNINTPPKYQKDYLDQKIGDTSLIKAQFIVDNFSSSKDQDSREFDFCKDLRNQLYGVKAFSLLKPSSLNSVVEFIDRHYDVNDAVVTYNYDDLLEQSISHKTSYSVDSVYTDRKLENKDLTIYHVHGYLPRKGRILKEHAKAVILSEYKYNYLFNNPLTWQVSCQLTRFRENICLLVGLSISDPSMRRILEYVKQTNPNAIHYAIFAKESKFVSSIYDYIAVTKHFDRIGIKIMWVDKYSDIPTLIDML